jgi:hypothetical protein
MYGDDVLILKGDEINALLAGRESDLIETVRAAYEIHHAGSSSLPHSTFLRFPEGPEAPGADPFIVLSRRFWQRQLNAEGGQCRP